jgi:hypothetical protein
MHHMHRHRREHSSDVSVELSRGVKHCDHEVHDPELFVRVSGARDLHYLSFLCLFPNSSYFSLILSRASDELAARFLSESNFHLRLSIE